MATAATAAPNASNHATAHQPREGGRPEGNSRAPSTSKAMLGYHKAADSQAAAPLAGDQGPASSA